MNTDWQFYLSSHEAWEAMLDIIDKAKVSIDMECFIFENDSVGNRFLDIIEKKVSLGVKIRLLLDEVGSLSLYNSNIQKRLSGLNVEVKFFNSLIPWSINRESLWYFRDHKRILIVDDSIGFTGGVCISDRMTSWRESCIKIQGTVIKEMKQSFDMMWKKKYRKPSFYLRRKSKKNNKELFSYITNSPIPGRRFMYYELIRSIINAKHYLYLTTPYFLPDSRLLRSIKKASRKGVKVILLVPSQVDHAIVDIGSRTFFEDLLEHKIRIFKYGKPMMIHSKTAVIDGQWSTIGSMNLDNISLKYNFEGNIVSWNKNFCFELEKQFLEDLKVSEELTLPSFRSRPFKQKILEFLVWPIRKFL